MGGNFTMVPHRLVVRTSRRGRDNPGSTPGVDILNIKHEHDDSLILVAG